MKVSYLRQIWSYFSQIVGEQVQKFDIVFAIDMALLI